MCYISYLIVLFFLFFFFARGQPDDYVDLLQKLQNSCKLAQKVCFVLLTLFAYWFTLLF